MNWYCIHTKPKKENQVETYCRAVLGLETYYPQLREYGTLKRLRRLIVGPLFPRYFFCRFDLAKSYRGVRYAPDSLAIVNLGGQSTIVDDSLIAELKQWVKEGPELSEVSPSFSSGDSVEITDGPLQGLAAVILHARNDQHRVAILLSLLSTDARITIRRDSLKSVANAA
jgi:transcriptional antiterminator RfaH